MLLVGSSLLATKFSPFVFRTVPGAGQLAAMSPTNTVLYTPGQAIAVAGFDMWSAAADPLVGAGGATNVLLVLANGSAGTLAFFVNQTIASLTAGNVVSNGFAPSASVLAFADMHLYPSSFTDSQAANAHVLGVNCNAGTVTGTLNVRLYYRMITQQSPAP